MPNAVRFEIGIAPKEAIAFLRQKKMLASKVFIKELHNSALAKATTISRLSSLEMTKDIYQSLETAMRDGKGFHTWKKELVNEFERKGWIFGKAPNIRGMDGKLLADPKSGEYFGTPRRLNTIYRVNMQSAYSAARYQRLRDNVDHRPYWQYSAVGDARTRPAHLMLSGKIYRYDDPFWATFYPPNGFNCRCTVIALTERDLKRRGMDKPDDSSAFLVEVERPADKQGNREKTVGFKLSDGTVRVTDKGFDYNVGRLSYKPNLDLYPEKLAHEFAKVEMKGGEFKLGYERFEKAYLKEKEKLAINGKVNNKELLQRIEMNTSLNFKFASGIINREDRKMLGINSGTVWLSDETLIKQFNSRWGDKNFNVDTYAELPDVIYNSDELYQTANTYIFVKKVNDAKNYVVFTKYIKKTNELFMVSARLQDKEDWIKESKRYEVIR